MIENYDALFGEEFKQDGLKIGALGTQDISNLDGILLNKNRKSSSVHSDIDDSYTVDDTVGEDDIFNQMMEADAEEATRRLKSEKVTKPKVNQDKQAI